MNLNELPKIIERTKGRIGRGTSSGHGKTSGRGHKGDKARGKSPWYKVGGSRRSRLIKHLPQLRGIGNPGTTVKSLVVSLTTLDTHFKDGETVSIEMLLEKGLILSPVAKILGNGKLSKKLTVSVPVSKSAKAAIEQAGGSVTI
jgi:large subunit ribosomal protein L15